MAPVGFYLAPTNTDASIACVASGCELYVNWEPVVNFGFSLTAAWDGSGFGAKPVSHTSTSKVRCDSRTIQYY